MIEDELLKLRFKCGSRDALRCIYEKYFNNLLTLAMALLNDAGEAEDVVHDVFVSFAKGAEDFKLRGSLKSYLSTCVINRVRDRIRAKRRRTLKLEKSDFTGAEAGEPEQSIIYSEESRRLKQALSELSHEQREVIVLRVKGEMKFKEIARLQCVSINTIQGRYRYGLNKLRSILNGEVEE
ncbi:MAG: RNA polymerase sigma factor [Planctomycetota bacterium]|jgi:RNA polymerase sigma-70 factor (ECF subfamily)